MPDLHWPALQQPLAVADGHGGYVITTPYDIDNLTDRGDSQFYTVPFKNGSTSALIKSVDFSYSSYGGPYVGRPLTTTAWTRDEFLSGSSGGMPMTARLGWSYPAAIETGGRIDIRALTTQLSGGRVPKEFQWVGFLYIVDDIAGYGDIYQDFYTNPAPGGGTYTTEVDHYKYNVTARIKITLANGTVQYGDYSGHYHNGFLSNPAGYETPEPVALDYGILQIPAHHTLYNDVSPYVLGGHYLTNALGQQIDQTQNQLAFKVEIEFTVQTFADTQSGTPASSVTSIKTPAHVWLVYQQLGGQSSVPTPPRGSDTGINPASFRNSQLKLHGKLAIASGGIVFYGMDVASPVPNWDRSRCSVASAAGCKNVHGAYDGRGVMFCLYDVITGTGGRILEARSFDDGTTWEGTTFTFTTPTNGTKQPRICSAKDGSLLRAAFAFDAPTGSPPVAALTGRIVGVLQESGESILDPSNPLPEYYFRDDSGATYETSADLHIADSGFDIERPGEAADRWFLAATPIGEAGNADYCSGDGKTWKRLTTYTTGP